MDEATDIGPIAPENLRKGLQRQVQSTAEKGGELLLGGRKLGGRGFFYEPTVFSAIADCLGTGGEFVNAQTVWIKQ